MELKFILKDNINDDSENYIGHKKWYNLWKCSLKCYVRKKAE